MMRKVLLFLSLASSAFSCNKEEVLSAAPSVVGNWIHYTDGSTWEVVYIKEDGKGYIEWYTNWKLSKDIKEKTWYVKDNRLYLGKLTFSLKPYSISTYPTTPGVTTIEGYDTLYATKRYMVLNGDYYVEKN